MDYWHYQLMKHEEPDGEVWYGIHEYYEGGTTGYTVEVIKMEGSSKEDVVWQLENVLKDIEKYGVKEYE